MRFLECETTSASAAARDWGVSAFYFFFNNNNKKKTEQTNVCELIEISFKKALKRSDKTGNYISTLSSICLNFLILGAPHDCGYSSKSD